MDDHQLYKTLMEDEAPSEAALERLVGSAFTDGMLPEAYDPEELALRIRALLRRSGVADR